MTPVELVLLIADVVDNGWTPNHLRNTANHAQRTPNPAQTLTVELKRMAEIAHTVRPENRSPAAPLPPRPTTNDRANAKQILDETRDRLRPLPIPPKLTTPIELPQPPSKDRPR